MITVELTGTNQASACGRTVKAKGMGGPIGKLARLLVADGYAGHDLLHIVRAGTVCFTHAPLSYWAAHDATEGDGYSCRMVKHKPFAADVWER